jgi:hypothetical protein
MWTKEKRESHLRRPTACRSHVVCGSRVVCRSHVVCGSRVSVDHLLSVDHVVCGSRVVCRSHVVCGSRVVCRSHVICGSRVSGSRVSKFMSLYRRLRHVTPKQQLFLCLIAETITCLTWWLKYWSCSLRSLFITSCKASSPECELVLPLSSSRIFSSP